MSALCARWLFFGSSFEVLSVLFYNNNFLSETFVADQMYYLGPRLLRCIISYCFIAFSSWNLHMLLHKMRSSSPKMDKLVNSYADFFCYAELRQELGST